MTAKLLQLSMYSALCQVHSSVQEEGVILLEGPKVPQAAAP